MFWQEQISYVFGPSIYWMEWVLLAALLVLFLFVPRLALFAAMNRGLQALARRKTLAVAAVGVLVLALRISLLPLIPVPRPGIADEFGYLLAAETFVQGRLTNPVHPLWESFETYHVFHHPTYQTQYPPAKPLLLAAAWKLLGHPWWGELAIMAAMCAALTWMLQGWLSPYWSLAGGLLAVFRVGLFSYWINSYWGGALAALGGCLVMGALPRLVPWIGRRNASSSTNRVRMAAVMSIGAAALATSRPYEGLLVCLPAAVLVLAWLIRDHDTPKKVLLAQVVVPAVLILGCVCVLILYYQKQVTGDALLSPYAVAAKQYHVAQPFFFQQPLKMPHYNHIQFRYVYGHFELMYSQRMLYFWGAMEVLITRAVLYWRFFIGPLLTLPFLAAFWTLRHRKYWSLWAIGLLVAAGIVIESWIQIHYLAPAYCLIMIFLLQGTRRLRAVRIGAFSAGRRMIRGLPVLCAVMIVLRVVALPRSSQDGRASWPPNWAYSTQRLMLREQLEDKIANEAGRHLIVVRYRAAFHNWHEEWVYNGPDLQNGKMLWARSMDAARNCKLAKYYPDRSLWIVDHWGDLVRWDKVKLEQLCDPKHPIYEVNVTREWRLEQLRSRHTGRPVASTSGKPQRTAEPATLSERKN